MMPILPTSNPCRFIRTASSVPSRPLAAIINSALNNNGTTATKITRILLYRPVAPVPTADKGIVAGIRADAPGKTVRH